MSDITIQGGDALEVDYGLGNSGGRSVKDDVRLLVDGAEADSDPDTFASFDGAAVSGTLTWQTQSDTSGTFTVEVEYDGLIESIEATVEAQPYFDIALGSHNIPVEEGETYTAGYEVTNTGDLSGETDVWLEVDGVEEDRDQNVTVAGGETVSGELQWEADYNDSGDRTITLSTVDTDTSYTINVDPALPDSGISQEEDGDLAEYTGNTSFFSAVSSPTIGGSSHGISHSTDGTMVYVEAGFEREQYGTLSMYVFPQNANNELLFVDSTNGNVVFGVFFRADGKEQNGIYYSGSWGTKGTVTNSGSTQRSGGTELVSSGAVSKQYHHVKLENIGYGVEEVDISVDGTTVVTDEPFILSGTPDTVQLNSNSGSAVSRGFVDKIDTGE